jgi:U3 small nucleolar RNA-associated protein 21
MFSGSTNFNNYASCGDVRNVKMPQVSSKVACDGEQNDKDSTNQQQFNKEPVFALLDHQIPNLVTLSLLPRSQWQSLTNIDIIKVCFI